jgi:GNAT superfamily N-acetyltransferase
VALDIVRGDPDEPDTASLLRRNEAHSYSLYPPEGVHMLPSDALSASNVHFVVARDAGSLLGCGAAVLLGEGCAEIKRMFVDPAARRRGVASAILAALEEFARLHGVTRLLLETGPRQPEAIALYRRFGYRERGPFGGYREDPSSVFMEKGLE